MSARRLVRSAGWLLALSMSTSGCAQTANSVPGPQHTAVAGDKETCPRFQATVLPDDLTLVDRELVPYGPRVLGEEQTFASADQGRWALLVTGGYHDELLEAYDDLAVRGETEVEGTAVTLLQGELLGLEVQAALWRRADLPPPCDARGLVTQGLTAAEADSMLAGLRPRP